MQAEIRHFNTAAGYFLAGEGCHINELSNSADDPDVSIAEARVEAGQATRWHRLNGIAERYVLLSGRGLVEVGGLAATEVGAGAVVLIPPGCAQRIRNVGTDPLVFLAICTPRFQLIAYENIDEAGNELASPDT